MTGMLAASLAGCMGGPIAQQVASSLLMRAADQATSDAYDAYLSGKAQPPSPSTNVAVIPGHGSVASPTSSSPAPQMNEYWAAFLNTGFTEIKPTAEPLPEQTSSVVEDSKQALSSSALVTVEVWSLLLGEEKTVVLEKARLRGNDLASLQALPQWQVAVGAAATAPQSPLTFLVPPELGRINSGQTLLVEISEHGDLNIARYRLEPQRAFQQAARRAATNQP